MSTLEESTMAANPLDNEHIRTGLSKAALERAFGDNLFYLRGRFPRGGDR